VIFLEEVRLNISKKFNLSKRLSIIFLLSSLAACASSPQQMQADFDNTKKEDTAIAQAVPAPTPEVTSSLWGSKARLFRYGRQFRQGDLITVVVSESASAKRKMDLNKKKTSTSKAGISAMLGVENSIVKANPNITPSALLDFNTKKDFKGAADTSNSDTLTATLTAVVIGVYANGNMKISAKKMLEVNGNKQMIKITGLIRPQDITANNEIKSSQIAQAYVSYGASGQMHNTADDGWLAKIIEGVWPL